MSLRVQSVLTGLVGGFVSGLTGVGGGTVMVPLLTGYMRLPQRMAHGTSLSVVIFAAAAAAAGYIWRGDVDWTLAGTLLAGSTVGAFFGARLILQVGVRELRLAFSVALLAAGVRMLVT